ncbi:MAG: DUF4136 domain-containing protein [Gammaproteobacteria bacterium]|nr:DUF4136 domain-containing protein [Gammaproteobacteria bacterium]
MKLRPLFSIALTTCAMLLLAACSRMPMHEFDPEANFDNYQSWRWQAPEYGNGDVADPILDSPLLGKRVEAAVNEILGGRGFSRDAEHADFVVTYHTSKDFDLYDNGPSFSIGLAQGWRHFHTGVVYDTRTRVDKKGVLIIDIIDAETDALAWRGWTTLPLAQEYFDSPKLLGSVRDILAAFPPGEKEATASQ